MHWLESKYVGLLSTRLRNFKRKSNTLYNFSCPLCGDSEIKKSKARGYIYEKQGKSLFHCHNCGITLSISKFIKTVDVNLYNEFVVEKIKENESPEKKEIKEFVNKMKPPVFRKSGPFKNLQKISQLKPEDPVKKFIVNRKIPNPYHATLFKCPNFMHFTNELVPNKFSEDALKNDETRIVIPFFDTNKNIFAYQGRSLSKSDIKYITIVLDENVPKIYGLDRLEISKTYYVFEGPFDSMFIDNSIATGGGDIVAALASLKSPKENCVIVYDNEKRSKETVKKIDKAIVNGYNVCIWPQSFLWKDVNDAIMEGLTSEQIKDIIDSNTYKDLSAKLALQQWKLT